MEDAYLLDANVPIYHLGGPSPWKAGSTEVMRGALDGSLLAYASTEMVQEVVHHRLRATGDPRAAAQNARDVCTGVVILGFDWEVLDLALEFVASGRAGGRDAVHAATAATYGIKRIISADTGFDRIPGIVRIDPREFAA